jgi:uncharacterized YigZ family protein
MNLPDEIKTIDEFREFTTNVKKSNFIAQVYSINSEEEFKSHLTIAKKKYYDATHHCYAYKIVNGTFRYSDAGEPNGTAGIRILNAIEHFGLSNQLVIVSRIFGGIKLGVGPLGKAYYQSAFDVLNGSNINTKHLYRKVDISSEIEQISLIHRILINHKSLIIETDYQQTFKLSCLIKTTEIESISQKFSDSGKSKIGFTIQSEFVYK